MTIQSDEKTTLNVLPGDEVVMVSGADSWHHLLINKRDVGDPVLVLTAKVIVRMYMCNTLRKELKH